MRKYNSNFYSYLNVDESGVCGVLNRFVNMFMLIKLIFIIVLAKQLIGNYVKKKLN